MGHGEVYNWFALYFPEYAGDRVDTWFQNGKNSIRIRLTNRQEFVFTIHNKNNWKFETLDSFISGLRGGKNNG